MKHEHTHHVAADADKVYAALADVSNLPHYVPQMTRADLHDGDKVTVEARYDGHTQHGEAWFRTDDAKRRIEWGAAGSEYNGWLQVDPDNAASRRVAEKAGFVLEGILRGYELIKERRSDVAMYARLAE